MALTNNLVLAKADSATLVEAMAQRQPGDRLTITVEVTVVENLTDRVSFDVESVASISGGGAAPADESTPADELLADSVLGVMGKKKR